MKYIAVVVLIFCSVIVNADNCQWTQICNEEYNCYYERQCTCPPDGSFHMSEQFSDGSIRTYRYYLDHEPICATSVTVTNCPTLTGPCKAKDEPLNTPLCEGCPAS